MVNLEKVQGMEILQSDLDDFDRFVDYIMYRLLPT